MGQLIFTPLEELYKQIDMVKSDKILTKETTPYNLTVIKRKTMKGELHMNTILILEDDDSVNRGITFTLEKEGYQVKTGKTIKEARAIIREGYPQIMICDRNLPDGDGLDFIQEVRKASDVYIICLTAMDEEIEQVMGYGAGADDYMTKPFSLSVLTLKIRAHLERSAGKGDKEYVSGEIRLCITDGNLMVREIKVPLSKNEWRLLQLFLENPKQILSKEQILEQLFDKDGNFVDENTVAVNITRLRNKIEEDKSNPQYIKNIRGLGYIWDQECKKR